MPQFSIHKRPSDLVEDYLLRLFQDHPLPEGARLPSTRYIARQVGVSEGTVRNVLQRWKKEGTIYTRAGSGIFTASKVKNLSRQRIHIGTNAGIVDTSQFGGFPGKILLSAFNMVMKLGASAALSSLFSKEEYEYPPTEAEVHRRCDDFDAILISLSTVHISTLIEYCVAKQKPYVVLNPPREDATVNFVSPNHFGASYRLGKALKQAGRRKFAILVFPSIERSIVIRQRIAGLVNALGVDLGVHAELRVIECEDWRQETGRAWVTELIESGYIPDAILTAGDHLTLGAMDALETKGLRCPSQVSVISGGGVESEVATREVTRQVLPAEEMGRLAISKITDMLKEGTCTVPGAYLDIPLVLGQTTTPQENALLGAALASSKQG